MAIYVPSGSNRVSTTLNKNTTSDTMIVRSGGTATKTTVNPGCSITLDGGGSAAVTVIKSGGVMQVVGYAASTTVSSGASMILVQSKSTPTAVYTDLKSGGKVIASSGTVLGDSWISGSVELKSGAVLSHAAVNAPGVVHVSSGALATGMNINRGGILNVQGRAGELFVYGSVSVFNGGAVSGMKVESGGVAGVNGSVSATVVSTLGRLRVGMIGTANGTTVSSAGILEIDGGKASSTVLQEKSVMSISRDGYAFSTTISSGASLNVLSGSASNTTISSGGTMTLSSGGFAVGTGVSSGGSMRLFGGASNTTLQSSGHCAVFSGGSASLVKIFNDAIFMVASGGQADNITVYSGGTVSVYSGGFANSITLSNRGFARISGNVENVTVSNGRLIVYSGGRASQVTVMSGSGALFFGDGSNVRVSSGGLLELRGGGSVENTSVFVGGKVVVSSGAGLSGAAVQGSITVSSGGCVKRATLTPTGVLTVSSGGSAAGRLRIQGASMNVSSGGVVEFSVNDALAGSGIYFIDDLSRISGAPTFTITVSQNQNSGIYSLAQGASGFTGTISVGDGTVVYGQLSANGAALVRGSYSYSLLKNGSNLTFSVSRSENSGPTPQPVPAAFIDDSDNWTDIKTNGGAGAVKYLEKPLTVPGYVTGNWVGAGDEVDYLGFEINSGAGLSFHVEASDAAKFTVYSLNRNKNGTYSLKSLQSVALKLDKSIGKYVIDTGKLLLNQGTYYIGVNSTNAKKGGSAAYTVSVNNTSEFFTKADNGDDWSDLREAGLGSYQRGQSITLVSDGELIGGNWVGFGDEADYMEFSLIDPARLSFHIEATDALKFTIYTLSENPKNHTFSLKALQSTALKKNKSTGKYEIDTRDLLLSNMQPYYIGVNSTNAKKGGSADYSVSVNGSSLFYTRGDNGDDWTDVAFYGENGLVNRVGIGAIASPGTLFDDGWVGFGDEADYMQFSVLSGAKLSFRVEATDAARFTVYTLNRNAKTGKYSLKALQTSTLKLDKNSGKYFIDTAGLLLGEGKYYIGVNGINAKKGGSADYSVSVNGSSLFYTKGDKSDDWSDLQTLGNYSSLVDGSSLSGFNIASSVSGGWVGFDDEVDYMKFDLQHGAKLSFRVEATDAAKFTVYTLNWNAKTGKYSLKALQTTNLKWDKSWHEYTANTADLWLGAGTYYVAVNSTSAKKGGSADYGFSVNGSSIFFNDGQNYDDWSTLKDMGDSGLFRSLGSLSSSSWQTPLVSQDWVGFGDEVDYMRFDLDSSARLSFDMEATDAAKLTVYTLNQNAKTGKYSLKALQTSTLKLDKNSGKYSVDTADLWLTAGTYYIGVNVVNPKKDFGAEYTLSVDSSSRFLPASDNSDDTWKLARDNQSALSGGDDCIGWVGYGDAADYFKLDASSGKLRFGLDHDTLDAVDRKELKLSCLNEKGQSLTVTRDGSLFCTTKDVAAGIYYLGVSCANVKKYDTAYRIMYLA